MGLDIYVGPLCRYYNGDWMTIMGWPEDAGELMGREPHLESTEALIPEVLKWRDALEARLGSDLTGPLDWSEDPTQRYYTDKPGWESYQALMLWARYASLPGKEPPLGFDPTGRRSDAASEPLVPPGQDDLASPLEYQMWLPCGLRRGCEFDDPSGEPRYVEGLATLVAALDEINARTWRAGPELLAEWLRRGPAVERNGDLVPLLSPWAEFGFSVFEHLSRIALRERLPMLLDW